MKEVGEEIGYSKLTPIIDSGWNERVKVDMMIGLKQGTQLDLKYIDEYEARNYIDALEHKFNKNKFFNFEKNFAF